MRKCLVTLAAALFLSVGLAPARAEASNLGLGFLWASHPVGLFFKINDKTTAHVALRFAKFDVESGSGQQSSSIGFAGAILLDMWSGDCWGFGFAPGVAFTSDSFEDFGTIEVDGQTEIHIRLWLMGHWDPCDWLSFWFGHGITIDMHSNGDSTTNFETEGVSLGNGGFTVWLP